MKGGELLAGGGEGALDGFKFGVSVCGGGGREELSEAIGTEREGAGGSGRTQKTAAGDVPVVTGLGRDLRGGDVGRFADEHFVDLAWGRTLAPIRHGERHGRYRKKRLPRQICCRLKYGFRGDLDGRNKKPFSFKQGAKMAIGPIAGRG